MDATTDSLEDTAIRCHLHKEQKAEAVCTKEDCVERIMCKKCFITIHPDHSDYFVNLNDILVYDSSKESKINLEKAQFIGQLRQGTERITQIHNQTKMDIEFVDNLSNMLSSNPVHGGDNEKNLLQLIGSYSSGLGTQKEGKNIIVDDVNVSNSIYQNLKPVRDSPRNSKEVAKLRQLQGDMSRIYHELSKTFGELTKELNLACPPKLFGSNIQTDPVNNCEKNRIEGLQENPNISQNGGTSIVGGKTPSPSASKYQGLEKTVLTQSSTINSAISEKESEFSRDGLVGVKLFSNNNPEKTILEEIETFFEEEHKELVVVFEKWFEYAEKNPGKVSSEITRMLTRQKAIIKAYHRITKKPEDIKRIHTLISEFIENVQSNKPSQDLITFEKTLQAMEGVFIQIYRDFADESHYRSSLDLMAKSRVIFDYEVQELTERLHKFRLFWIEKQPKLNQKLVEKIQFSEYERIILELWQFQIKLPEVENLLMKYFECQRLRLSIKHFLLRFSQSETARINLFDEGFRRDEAALTKTLEEVSLEKAISIKKKCESLCEGIDLGDDLEVMLKMIDKAQQLQTTIAKATANNSLNPFRNSFQELIKDCSSLLYFPDMLKLKTLNRLFGPGKLTLGTPSSHESLTPKKIICEEEKINRERGVQSETQESIINYMTAEGMTANNHTLSSKMHTQTQELPTPIENPIPWITSIANFMAQICEDNGNHTKANEIKQALTDFEDNSESFANLSSLCMSCTQELFKDREKQHYQESLNKIVSEGLKQGSSHSEEVKKLFNYFNILRWAVKTNTILNSADPSIEQLKECHRESIQGQFGLCEENQILSIHFKLTGLIKLLSDLQDVETADWYNVLEQNSNESSIKRLNQLERTYQCLGVQNDKIWQKIQENLALFNTGNKLIRQDSESKYRPDELEKFLEKIKHCSKAGENLSRQVSNIEQLISTVKELLIQSEHLRELPLEEIAQILSDFLQNSITKANFFEKMNDIMAYLETLKKRIGMLKNSCAELASNHFDRINCQLGALNEQLIKTEQCMKQGRLKGAVIAIGQEGSNSTYSWILWVLVVSAALNFEETSNKNI